MMHSPQAISSRQLVLFFVLAIAGGSFAPAAEDAPQPDARPNILFAISDDQSYPYASAYGTSGISTPAFDRVAKSGVLFSNAFCASPGCSPCRAAILTGRHTWEIEQAGTHASSFPKQYGVYPDLLESAGYHIGYTGKGWGPGNYKISGRTRNPAGPGFSSKKTKAPKGMSSNDYAANFAQFLESRKKGQPFYFWYGGSEPHRVYDPAVTPEDGKRALEVMVPSFLPDTTTVRADILNYCQEIEYFDLHLGRMLSLLEEQGELDNTLVIVTSDNGMPFPRAKANCYEYGIHAPLAVSWPKQVAAERKSTDLIQFIDFGPTMLEAAGVPVPKVMTGRSFLNVLKSGESGQIDETRTAAYSARERHSSSRYKNWTYPIRSLRTSKYLYIRNFEPDRWPAGDPTGFRNDAFGYYDIDGGPTKTFLVQHNDGEQFKSYFDLAVGKRPAEELYNVVSDPANMTNLASCEEYEAILIEHRKMLEAELRRTKDPRILGTGAIYDDYKRYSPIRSFPAPDAVQETE